MPGSAGSRLPDRRTCQLLALCAAVAFVLDFLYFSGYFGSDDLHYLEAARQLAHPGQDLPGFAWRDSIAHTRLGITVPAGLVYWLTGGSIVLIAWFHILYHLALVVLAYAVGREVREVRTGLLAAALVATSPILYVYAGAVLPDNATAAWLALLLLLLLRAARRARETPFTVRESFTSYFVAGLVFGLAYGCKETALIMAIPCALVIMAAAPRLRSTVWIRDGAFLAAGLVVFVLLEALVFRGLSGEWIWRIGAVEGSGDVMAERMEKQGTGVFERFGYLWSVRISPLMPVTAVVLLGLAVGFLFLRRRNFALITFFWWPLIYLTVGSTSFSRYLPSSIQDRYYAIIVVPAAVIAAITLGWLLERWEGWERRPRWAGRRWAAGALVVAIAAISIHEARHNAKRGGNIYRCEVARAFVVAFDQAVADYPDHPIVLSRGHRKWMSPVLFNRPLRNIWAGKSLTPWTDVPKLPLILLSPDKDALPEGRNYFHELRMDVDVQTLDTVYPVRQRTDVIAAALRNAFGFPRRRKARLARRGATVIQLLTAPTEPPTP